MSSGEEVKVPERKTTELIENRNLYGARGTGIAEQGPYDWAIQNLLGVGLSPETTKAWESQRAGTEARTLAMGRQALGRQSPTSAPYSGINALQNLYGGVNLANLDTIMKMALANEEAKARNTQMAFNTAGFYSQFGKGITDSIMANRLAESGQAGEYALGKSKIEADLQAQKGNFWSTLLGGLAGGLGQFGGALIGKPPSIP